MKTLLILLGSAMAVNYFLSRSQVAQAQGGAVLMTGADGRQYRLSESKDGFLMDQFGGRWA